MNAYAGCHHVRYRIWTSDPKALPCANPECPLTVMGEYITHALGGSDVRWRRVRGRDGDWIWKDERA